MLADLPETPTAFPAASRARVVSPCGKFSTGSDFVPATIRAFAWASYTLRTRAATIRLEGLKHRRSWPENTRPSLPTLTGMRTRVGLNEKTGRRRA